MFTLIIQKIFHKKWLAACLLIGNMLLVAIAVSYPMYRDASFKQMLTSEFAAYEDEMGVWPFQITVKHTRSIGRASLPYDNYMKMIDQMVADFGVPVYQSNSFLSTSLKEISPVIERSEKLHRLARISTMNDLSEHVEIVMGREPADYDGTTQYIEVMISDAAAGALDVLLNEVYEFDGYEFLTSETPLRIQVVGVFSPLNSQDEYWVEEVENLNKDLFVSPQTFQDYFLTEEAQDTYGLRKLTNVLIDYTQMEPSDVSRVLELSEDYYEKDVYKQILEKNVYESILENYVIKESRIEGSLVILQIPVLLLLFSFIYMISSQMLSMEANEISVMKSRGAKSYQILGLYLGQNVILSVLSFVAGLPLGKLICNALGTATNFMEFNGNRVLEARYSQDAYLYGLIALCISLAMTLIPAASASKISIVNLKQSKGQKHRTWWKLICLDFICIGLSLYGYYTFSKNQGNIMEQVLTGESLDPLLYLSSSLFLFGMGLFTVRIRPWIMQLLFLVSKKRLSPSTYVALTDQIRGGHRQEFVLLFVTLTVALGIHSTTIARTIVANAEANNQYISGSEITFKEVWSNNISFKTSEEPIEYYEPDASRFTVLDGVINSAKVLKKEFSVSKFDNPIIVMGIRASDFARVAYMPDGLLPYDFVEYLKILSADKANVLASENFMTKKGYELGDVIALPDGKGGKMKCTIVGFFNYWPSYDPNYYEYQKDGSLKQEDKYMLVANLSFVQSNVGVTPYEMWVTTSDEGESIYDYIKANPKTKFAMFEDIRETSAEISQDTLFQGTNGILTMSFIVILILNGVGYLIYFILSIRQRELMFGVLRAMGMKKREITKMLLFEQISCGGYAMLMGGIVGIWGARLFVPIIQNAYTSTNQVLPLKLITSQSDVTQLYAIVGIVMLVCLFVIARIVAHMNITKALKLGED
ncbi:MAG: ABC transporter permease [Lachnospiraceae bacterium]|nr:ABC transporter permease [Lachnospiraceae bacterium]